MPSGEYLMEDFYYAGGLPAVLRELARTTCCTATRSRSTAGRSGRTPGRAVLESRRDPRFKAPFKKDAGIAVLRGNLCPEGAIIKPSARPEAHDAPRPRGGVREHRGLPPPHRRPKLDIDESCVMVLKNCGPKGYPGMAESATCRCRPSC